MCPTTKPWGTPRLVTQTTLRNQDQGLIPSGLTHNPITHQERTTPLTILHWLVTKIGYTVTLLHWPLNQDGQVRNPVIQEGNTLRVLP